MNLSRILVPQWLGQEFESSQSQQQSKYIGFERPLRERGPRSHKCVCCFIRERKTHRSLGDQHDEGPPDWGGKFMNTIHLFYGWKEIREYEESLKASFSSWNWIAMTFSEQWNVQAASQPASQPRSKFERSVFVLARFDWRPSSN